MKRMDFKKVMSLFGFFLKCPVCSAKYNVQNIKIIESMEDEHYDEARILIHSDCQKCKSSVMFNIDINGPEMITMVMATDLTGRETEQFSKAPPLGIDDCIEVHQSLKQFDGDFVKAFAQK